MNCKSVAIWCLASLTVASLFAAPRAQTPEPASKELKHGAMFGRVLDQDGKPVAGATVAVKSAGKILAWTKTDEKGGYALSVDPKVALNLRPSRHRGLLEQCVQGVGDVVMAPVKVVGDAVSRPGATVKSTVESVASGSPAPIAVQAVGAALPGKTAVQGAAARAALGDGPHSAAQRMGKKGEVQVVVSATGFKDADVSPSAYWLEGPQEPGGGLQAWVETVKLAPKAGQKQSEVVHEAITLSDPTVDPSLVPTGGTVKISVKLNSPDGPHHKVRVFAREARRATVVELAPGADPSVYSGSLTLDPKEAAGETTICIGALRASPVEVRLRPGKSDPLVAFVRRLDDMGPGKPYEYDPLIMASENRADVKVTVLPAKPHAG